MGTVTLAIAKMFPEPRFVIQDLPPVIEGAKMVSTSPQHFEVIETSKLTSRIVLES